MGDVGSERLTDILNGVRAGREGDRERLVRVIYGELRRLAGDLMRHERPGHMLQPSALVHEALLRLLYGGGPLDAPNSRYFYAAASQAMRWVLVDYAVLRDAAKRPDDRARVPLDEILARFEGQGLDLIALHEALEILAREHPRPAQVVELRFFSALSVPEVAETLELSVSTVEADWRFARARLYRLLGGDAG